MGSWIDQEWRIYDFETTGLDTETAHVCQIGVASMKAGALLSSRAILCNPGVPIPEEATAIHGITDAMVADAKPEAELLGKLAAWLSGAQVIVHYNGFRYDRKILLRIAGDSLRTSNATEIDVLTLVRSDEIGRWWKGVGRHRLTSVAERMMVEASGVHNAEADAVMTGRVLWQLCRQYDWLRTLPTGSALTEHLEAMAERHEADFQSWLARQPKRS